MVSRRLSALIDYSSDSDSGIPQAQLTAQQPAAKKRKTLPALPNAFASISDDDPSQHQGRTRSKPFVDGDYYAHLYLSLDVTNSLQAALRRVIDRAQQLCPKSKLHQMRPSLEVENGSDSLPLHVSLTHPLALRRSQLKEFENEIRHALMAAQSRQFRLSLGGAVKVYYNGRRTGGDGDGGRVFLALRVGAGSIELDNLLKKIVHPILSKYHLPLYHSDPEFHTSFAWSLLHPGGNPDEGEDGSTSSDGRPEKVPDNVAGTPILQSALDKLNEEYEKIILSAQPKNGWEIQHVELKIAKDVLRIPLHA